MGSTTDYQLNDSMGYWLHRASHALRLAFDLVLAPHGVTTGQWAILSLCGQQGAQTPTELVEAIGMDSGAMARLLGRMTKKGLLQVQLNPRDARSKVFALTPRAQQLLPKIKRLSQQTNLLVLHDLGPRQRSAFLDLLRRIEKRAEAIGPESIPES